MSSVDSNMHCSYWLVLVDSRKYMAYCMVLQLTLGVYMRSGPFDFQLPARSSQSHEGSNGNIPNDAYAILAYSLPQHHDARSLKRQN